MRSVTHGTCAVDGQHPPGSRYAAECPVLKREERLISRRRAWEARRMKNDPQRGAPATTGRVAGEA